MIETVQKIAKHGARLSIPAVHKKPVEVDFGALLADLVREPCLKCPARKGIADAPDHLRQQDRCKERIQSLDEKTDADQQKADDD